ncbi:hypothetical protein HYH03_018688 [Edaphochlamys debaryana]|uniref:Uncharacterized protein n=1 Tax=Edaphochlamys debaryana TaxID=47281 RepID=A0A836BP90_9CHLO|nr:hypothetical protein HYH03_018688 [Edaphochlamys debaryana]|eukprot:KAG2482368.1 hypothetical protein HYH03_018688 [Edaphochlamys debaryana]
MVKDWNSPQVYLTEDPKAVREGYAVHSMGTGLGYWTPTADMEFARSDHAVVSYDKYAYLVGGLNDNGQGNATLLASVNRYDTETGLMVAMAPMSQGRYRFAYALLDGKIYIMGGTLEVDGLPIDTVEVYDIASNTWGKTGKLTMPRIDACGAAINGKVYIIGGYDGNFRSLASLEVIDPATSTATAEPQPALLPASANLIGDRADCRAVTVDGYIYALGGTKFVDKGEAICNSADWIQCYEFLSSVERFDPNTQRWSPRAAMINPRGDFGVEALPSGRIIVAGGERGNGTQNQMAMYDVEEYIAADDIWIPKAPLPQARFRDDLAYVNGRVYAFGGTPTCALTADANASCYRLALKSVFAYFDVPYPRLYAFYQKDPKAPSKSLWGRRMA